MRTHEPREVREPAIIIGEALHRRRPRPGDVLVVRLESGDPDQALVDVVRAHRGDLPGRYEASDLLRTLAEAMVGERPWVDGGWMPSRHVFIAVVCRSARVVPGPEELFRLLACRYSNHHDAAYNGDVYPVPEHGWTGCADERAGFSPALPPRARHLAVHRRRTQEL